jgi:hypothetical protein
MDAVCLGEVAQVYISGELRSDDKRIDILKANPLCFSGLEPCQAIPPKAGTLEAGEAGRGVDARRHFA